MDKERFAAVLVSGMQEAYPFPEAMRTGAVLSSAIMKDFRGRLQKQEIGERYHEDYKTEDEKVIVSVDGISVSESGGMKYMITDVFVNGKRVSDETIRL